MWLAVEKGSGVGGMVYLLTVVFVVTGASTRAQIVTRHNF